MNRDDVRRMLRLYAVTDSRWAMDRTLEEQVELALRGGATCVQLREKELPRAAFLERAMRMRAICRRYDVPLIINDDIEIALLCGADGVHVGQSDTAVQEVRRRAQACSANLLVGVTAKTPRQALAAQAAGADYLGSGAVFGTMTKEGALPMTRAQLMQIVHSVSLPVVAIGGIHLGNIDQLAATGIAGAAIVSGIFAAQDIEGTCRLLRASCDRIAGSMEEA